MFSYKMLILSQHEPCFKNDDIFYTFVYNSISASICESVHVSFYLYSTFTMMYRPKAITEECSRIFQLRLWDNIQGTDDNVEYLFAIFVEL